MSEVQVLVDFRQSGTSVNSLEERLAEAEPIFGFATECGQLERRKLWQVGGWSESCMSWSCMSCGSMSCCCCGGSGSRPPRGDCGAIEGGTSRSGARRQRATKGSRPRWWRGTRRSGPWIRCRPESGWDAQGRIAGIRWDRNMRRRGRRHDRNVCSKVCRRR